MSKISVYIAISLDGFIARENGDINWLHAPEYTIEDEDFGYKTFMDSIDALVMGRHTYEKVRSFGGDWPYGDKPVCVLSSQGVDIPGDISNTVFSISGFPEDIVHQLGERGYQHLYLDGGKTIQRFLNDGLIDELILTRLPILIGNGIPLFGSLKNDIKLEHLTTQSYPNGFVQSHYRVKS
ncbi:MAG: dihydrofolate reductase [Balneolaceae bacterium]|nr:dihydrofolate reductase [Balneolaceae bacterium]